MNCIFIDDNKAFVEALCKELNTENQCDENNICCYIDNDIYQIAEDILWEKENKQTKYKIKQYDLLFINISLLSGKRQFQKGIELLIWLRIKGLMNHCIMYSFESLHTLLNRKPENLIATSQGTTFVQLPFDFSLLKIEELSLKKANLENLHLCLKPVFSIEAFRHQEANWWGIKCLHDVHRIVTIKSKEEFPYHSVITDNLNKLENAVASFLFSANERKIGIEVNDNLELIKSLRKEIIDSGKKPTIFYIDDKADEGWVDILIKMLYDGEVFLKKNTMASEFEKNLNIYYAKNEKTPVFYYVKNVNNLEFHTLAGGFVKFMENNSIDLLLLDLRLQNETGANFKIRDLSGYKLLKHIQGLIAFVGIPIIITTASNKISSYEEMIKIGADAYWIKEGIDEQKEANETVNNYIALLSLVNKLSGKEYRIYNGFWSAIQKFYSEQDRWWMKEIDWSQTGNEYNMNQLGIAMKTTPNEEMIFSILQDCFILFREYLQRKILKIHYDPLEEKQWVLPSLIIQHAGKIIELIHDTGDGNMGKDIKLLNSGLIRGLNSNANNINKKIENKKLYYADNGNDNLFFPIRCDELGSRLYQQRNEASHANKVEGIDLTDLESFFNDLIYYLNNTPQKDKRKYGQYD